MNDLGQMPESTSKDGTISLSDMLAALLRRRGVAFFCIGLCLLSSVVYLHLATYRYTAELDIKSVQSSQDSSSRLGSLGGLAAIAGVNLPQSQGASDFEIYLEGLKSRATADELSKRKDLMKVIFKKDWDEKSQTWRHHENILDWVSRGVKFLLGFPANDWQPPDGAQLEEYLSDNVTVVQTDKKLLVNILFEHQDPQFAVRFLDALNTTVDNDLRRASLERSNQYIQYLSDKLNTVTIAEYRQALTQSLIEQEKRRMMASSNLPFAAESFGPPTASFRPTSPKPPTVLVIGLFMGIFLGVISAIAYGLFGQSNPGFSQSEGTHPQHDFNRFVPFASRTENGGWIGWAHAKIWDRRPRLR